MGFPTFKETIEFNADQYTYTVAWDPELRDFVGRVSEFESLVAYGGSPEIAFEGILEAARIAFDVLLDEKAAIPVPLGFRSVRVRGAEDALEGYKAGP